MKRTKIYFRNLKIFEERIEGRIKENEAQIFIKKYEKCPDADGFNIYSRVFKILLDSLKSYIIRRINRASETGEF